MNISSVMINLSDSVNKFCLALFVNDINTNQHNTDIKLEYQTANSALFNVIKHDVLKPNKLLHDLG